MTSIQAQMLKNVKANDSEVLKVENNSIEIEKSKSSTSSEASWTVVGDGNDDNAEMSDQPQATVSNDDNVTPNDEKEDNWDEWNNRDHVVLFSLWYSFDFFNFFHESRFQSDILNTLSV